MSRHSFFALNLRKNADISIYLKIEGKDISSQISLEFTFTYRKANTFLKIFKLYGKWKEKNRFWYIFNSKIVATALLASLTAFLWFS